MKRISLIVLIASVSSFGFAQETNSPKTMLENFESQTGAVIIKGLLDVGIVKGLGSVAVECREFLNASTSRRQFGVIVDVTESGRLDRSRRSYLDLDEIDSLLKGIDYICKLDKTAVSLPDFEASYTTKGGLRVLVFTNKSGKLESAVDAGGFGSATAYLTIEQLSKLRSLLQEAQIKLSSISKTHT